MSQQSNNWILTSLKYLTNITNRTKFFSQWKKEITAIIGSQEPMFGRQEKRQKELHRCQVNQPSFSLLFMELQWNKEKFVKTPTPYSGKYKSWDISSFSSLLMWWDWSSNCLDIFLFLPLLNHQRQCNVLEYFNSFIKNNFKQNLLI